MAKILIKKNANPFLKSTEKESAGILIVKNQFPGLIDLLKLKNKNKIEALEKKYNSAKKKGGGGNQQQEAGSMGGNAINNQINAQRQEAEAPQMKMIFNDQKDNKLNKMNYNFSIGSINTLISGATGTGSNVNQNFTSIVPHSGSSEQNQSNYPIHQIFESIDKIKIKKKGLKQEEIEKINEFIKIIIKIVNIKEIQINWGSLFHSRMENSQNLLLSKKRVEYLSIFKNYLENTSFTGETTYSFIVKSLIEYLETHELDVDNSIVGLYCKFNLLKLLSPPIPLFQFYKIYKENKINLFDFGTLLATETSTIQISITKNDYFKKTDEILGKNSFLPPEKQEKHEKIDVKLLEKEKVEQIKLLNDYCEVMEVFNFYWKDRILKKGDFLISISLIEFVDIHRGSLPNYSDSHDDLNFYLFTCKFYRFAGEFNTKKKYFSIFTSADESKTENIPVQFCIPLPPAWLPYFLSKKSISHLVENPVQIFIARSMKYIKVQMNHLLQLKSINLNLLEKTFTHSFDPSDYLDDSPSSSPSLSSHHTSPPSPSILSTPVNLSTATTGAPVAGPTKHQQLQQGTIGKEEEMNYGKLLSKLQTMRKQLYSLQHEFPKSFISNTSKVITEEIRKFFTNPPEMLLLNKKESLQSFQTIAIEKTIRDRLVMYLFYCDSSIEYIRLKAPAAALESHSAENASIIKNNKNENVGAAALKTLRRTITSMPELARLSIKHEISIWWSTIISSKINDFLLSKNFYFILDPSNFPFSTENNTLIQSNLKLIENILLPDNPMISKLIQEIQTILMPKIDVFIENAIIVVCEKLNISTTNFSCENALDILSKFQLDANKSEWIDSLIKDIEALQIIKQLESSGPATASTGSLPSSSSSSDLANHTVPSFTITSVSGLIIDEFKRLKSEMESILSTWE